MLILDQIRGSLPVGTFKDLDWGHLLVGQVDFLRLRVENGLAIERLNNAYLAGVLEFEP